MWTKHCKPIFLLLLAYLMAVSLQFRFSSSRGGDEMGAKLCNLRNSGAATPPSDDDEYYNDKRVDYSRSFLRKLKPSYSAAEERIVEVESKEEFDSCKVGNPIRMYTEGLSTVSLENEGSRYFISSRLESCQNGLKLHVTVQPQSKAVREIKGDDAVNRGVAAEGPKPSSCSHFHQGSPLKWFAMAFICFTISFSSL